jgi:cleavage and polyadenylation specificity factor subunit 1
MCPPQAFKPYNGKLGFRQLPLGAAVLGHGSPAPPAAAAVSGIQGMPAADTPPTRLARFDNLATPRLDPPLGPGFRPPGLNPSDSLAGPESGGRGLGGPPLLHYSGVFVCGPKPLWLVATRGGLVVHPIDGVSMGAVDAFCGFHNVNCPHGYIAAALEGDMRVCTLPLQVCFCVSHTR